MIERAAVLQAVAAKLSCMDSRVCPQAACMLSSSTYTDIQPTIIIGVHTSKFVVLTGCKLHRLASVLPHTLCICSAYHIAFSRPYLECRCVHQQFLRRSQMMHPKQVSVLAEHLPDLLDLAPVLTASL